MQWQLSLAGQPVTFTADEAPNGKVVVRRNGRIVAPPLAPGEHDRVFRVDGEELRLWRNGDALELEVVPRAVEEEEQVVVEPTPAILDEPLERESWWVAYDPPVSVVIRARVYFAVMLLVFIGAGLQAMRVHRMRDMARQFENRPMIGDAVRTDERSFARFEKASSIILFGLSCVAFCAALAFTGAGFLIRGFRWAPPMLEIVTWLMLGFWALTAIRLDRLVHMQLNAAYDPVPALTEMQRLHASSVSSGIFIALILGGLLHLVGRRTVERLYEQESY